MLGYTVTEFQEGNLITIKVIGCQVHAIGKAITQIWSHIAFISSAVYTAVVKSTHAAIQNQHNVH